MFTCPAAKAAAEPPDEPPAESWVFHGFRVLPKQALNVLAPASMHAAVWRHAESTDISGSAAQQLPVI